jgi:hypothetical protein
MKFKLVFLKTTKNYQCYEAQGEVMGKLYFPKTEMPNPPEVLEPEVAA